jgi:amino acid adenylation domain-containing protein/non-ribosomal peptide synthase protein (TIGR01720 family)
MANIGYLIELKGSYDLDRLARAIQLVVKANEGLQMRFRKTGNDSGDLVQYLPEYEAVAVEKIEVATQEELAERIEALHRQRFEVGDHYMCSFAVFSIGGNRFGFFEKAHHMVADGLSAVAVAREIIELYPKLEAADLEEPSKEHSYIDFINDEQDYIKSEKYNKDKNYWLERLGDFSGEDVTFDLNPRRKNSLRVQRASARVPMDIMKLLEEYQTAHRLSNFALFMAALAIYFHRFLDHEDMVIGMPVHNRSKKIFRSMTGMFVSTLPFRIPFDPDWSFDDLVAFIKRGLWDDLKHQSYPFNHLIKDLKEAGVGTGGLLNVQLIELPGADDQHIEKRVFFNTEYNISELSIYLNQQNTKTLEELELAIDFHVDIFDEREVQYLVKRLMTILRQCISMPAKKIADLPLIESDEYQNLIHNLNDTKADFPTDKTLPQLIMEQVNLKPDAIALDYNGETVTYRQLDTISNTLAAQLQSEGFAAGAMAGILSERSIEAVVSILAILKAGGAYLPIDPAYPLDRKQYIIENSGIAFLLVEQELLQPEEQLLSSLDSVNQITIDYTTLKQSEAPATFSPPDIDPSAAAYVIYTSGTTGKPKGTAVSHRNVVNYIWWGAGQYVKGEEVCFALYSSLSFDLTVTSIFIPLVTGNTIAIYRHHPSGLLIEHVISDNKADIVKLTPSHLKIIKEMKGEKPRVKRFIVGGEELNTATALDTDTYFDGNIEIYNEYGPTEATVGCMIHRFDKKTDTGASVPIGKPADNTAIYILDKQLRPLPKGIVGEIYIAGSGVAIGYLNNEALTTQRFLNDPFVPGQRMYKSGDLGRWNLDNTLEFFGRSDEQLKIRGFRIEPGEIEQQLLSLEAVKNAVVVPVEDKSGQKSLCAYMTSTTGETKLDIRSIRKQLATVLPDYMVPSYFVTMESIPLTNNGKVDRRALPDPLLQVTTGEDTIPAGETEQFVKKVWADVLGFDNVGMEDNFFELGGDSIKAVQIASRMHDVDLSVNAKDILEHQTVSKLCSSVDFKSHVRQYQQGIISGIKDLTPIDNWFFSHKFPHPHHYNQSALLELKQEIDLHILEKTFSVLIEHHDGLRLNYDPLKRNLFFNNRHLERPFKIEFIEGDIDIEAKGREIKGSFDLENDLLIKAALFAVTNSPFQLLITAHHLVMDGISWRVLLEDLNKIYTALEQGQPVQLSKKSASVAEWQDALRDLVESGKLDKDKEYWDAPTVDFKLPLDHDTTDWSLQHLAVAKASLDATDTDYLLKEAHETYKTDTLVLVASALVRTLRAFTNQQHIEFEMENHGRHIEDIDVSRTIGWFTAIFPIRVTRDDNSIGDEIKTVKEAIRKVPFNGLSYGLLNHMDPYAPTQTKQVEVRFNYLGQFDSEVDTPLFSYSHQSTGPDVSPNNHLTAKLEINAMILKGTLKIDINHNKKAYNPETIETFANDYIKNLKEILNHIKNEDNVHFTPSDFDTVDLSEDDLAALFE